jgi:hypothetical protein
MAEFLFALAEWAGVDVKSKSRGALIVALVVQLLFAVLMLGGGILALVQHDGTMGILIGILLLVFGVGLLVRIAINLRTPPDQGGVA